MAIDSVTQNPAVTAVLHYKSGNDFIPVSSTNKLPVEGVGGGGGGGGSDPNQQLTQLSNGNVYTTYIPAPAVSGEFSAVQIKNPTGSGKNILIYSVDIVGIDASPLQYYLFKGTTDYPVSANVPINMKTNSVNTSIAEIRVGSDSGAGIPLFTNILAFDIVVQSQRKNLLQSGEVVIGEGDSVVVYCVAQNKSMSVELYFAEI